MIRMTIAGLALAFCASAVPTATAAAPAETFDVGSARVERHGEVGPPLILIPGLASGAWVWQDTIAALAGEHRIYAVTLAGFDGRPPAAGDALAQASGALEELIASRRLERPVLVGHSLGGILALTFAAAHSDLVRGVVAVDALPVFPTTETVPAAQRPALAERVRAQIAGLSTAEFEAQQFQYMQRIGVVDAAAATAAAQRTSRSDPKAVAGYAAAVMALDARAQLPGIRVPVLEVVPYLAGDYAAAGVSAEGKRAYYASLLAGVTQLEVVTIAPARHFVMLDQPQAFVAALRGFLAGLKN